MVNSITPENIQKSIVLIGDFNPHLFQPEWFRRNGVLSPEEIQNVEESKALPMVVSNQITFFKTSQLDVRIEQNRFQVVAEKEPFIVLKDFVTKTFEQLGGLIIDAAGFNYSAHYRIQDMKTLQLIGDRLAPKKFWKDLLEDEVSGDERKSGLVSISMSKVKGNDEGHLSMVLQPSNVIKPGVYISCNNHTGFKDDGRIAENVMDKLDETFEESFAKMKHLQLSLLDEVLKQDV